MSECGEGGGKGEAVLVAHVFNDYLIIVQVMNVQVCVSGGGGGRQGGGAC